MHAPVCSNDSDDRERVTISHQYDPADNTPSPPAPPPPPATEMASIKSSRKWFNPAECVRLYAWQPFHLSI
jgi:hypothetical protein